MSIPPFPSGQHTVLIVGGGPTGFAVALMLAQRGWMGITVLEKRAAADAYEPDKSFNYLIDGRGQKLTDLLGLTGQLASIGVSSQEFYLTRIQPNGDRKTAKVPIIDPKRKPAYWVPRRAFVNLLYQDIAQHWSDRITVLFSTRCVAINKVQTADATMLNVIVENLETSAQQQFQPTVLIGCDGLNSIVRATLQTWDGSGRFAMQQFPSPSSGLRYKVLSLPPNFPLDREGTEPAISTMAYTVRSTFRDRRRSLSLGLLPLADPAAPRTANLVTRPNHHLWNLTTAEDLLTFLEQAFPQLSLRHLVTPEEAERLAQSRGGSFPVPQYCTGLHHLEPTCGVLLLGDAVHCFPPDIGQGVNAALEDVAVLHQVLAEQGDDLARSLPQYEGVRSPDVRAVVRLVQVAAPWQYQQNPWRSRLWAIVFAVRLGLSKVLPLISPPAFFLVQNHDLSYQEIWLREQRTARWLLGMGAIGLTGLAGLVLRWLQ